MKSVVWSKRPRHRRRQRRRHNERGKNRINCQIQIVWVLWIVKCQFLHTSISLTSTPCYRDFNVCSTSNMCVERKKISVPFSYIREHTNTSGKEGISIECIGTNKAMICHTISFFHIFFLKKLLCLLDTTDKFELNHSQCPTFQKSTMTLFTTNEQYFHYLLIGQHTWTVTIDEATVEK